LKVGPLFLDLAAVVLLASLVEAILLQRFNRWYFRLGPALLRLSADLEGSWRPQELAFSLAAEPHLAATGLPGDAVLVRRSSRALLLPWDLPLFWSPRITIALRHHARRRAFSLELRYTICWPLFAGIACLGAVLFALYSLFTPYKLGAILLLLAGGLIALYVYVAATNARNDARHVWDLAKHHLASIGDHPPPGGI